MKRVLTIAGSDCSGGAGIQADLKTFSALKTFGMSVVTSVVAENTFRVISVENVSAASVKDQIDAVMEDIFPDAVKIGMLAGNAVIEAVAKKLKQWKPPHIVFDPVMFAKNGAALTGRESLNCLIDNILPLADIITPNIPEAEEMTGITVSTHDDMKKAAQMLYGAGCRHVLVKGGHLTGDAADILFDGFNFYCYSVARIPTKNTHGTGCTFSSAIAAFCARGLPMQKAVAAAKNYITGTIADSLPLGKGNGPLHHFHPFYTASEAE